MLDNALLHRVLGRFDIPSARGTMIVPFGNGHINHTFHCGTVPPTVLQHVNRNVFPHPEEVMENIAGVTAHLQKKLTEGGGDPKRETVTLIPERRTGLPYVMEGGECYRLAYCVERAISLETAEPESLYRCAKVFGKFLHMLADYPVESLHEVIPDFHNTKSRFAAFKAALAEDKAGRAKNVQPEIDYVLKREGDCSVIVDAIAAGEVPVRVTHNDTKLNNFLFDERSGECIALIDLDTVMPGSLLYDYGDALRFGASSAAEDETDLSKVFFRQENIDAFTKGFLEEFGSVLTPRERELLPFSIKLLTLECGIRFLTDYLNGDTYFGIKYPNHNLDRARNQFALVSDMEKKLESNR